MFLILQQGSIIELNTVQCCCVDIKFHIAMDALEGLGNANSEKEKVEQLQCLRSVLTYISSIPYACCTSSYCCNATADVLQQESDN